MCGAAAGGGEVRALGAVVRYIIALAKATTLKHVPRRLGRIAKSEGRVTVRGGGAAQFLHSKPSPDLEPSFGADSGTYITKLTTFFGKNGLEMVQFLEPISELKTESIKWTHFRIKN